MSSIDEDSGVQSNDNDDETAKSTTGGDFPVHFSKNTGGKASDSVENDADDRESATGLDIKQSAVDQGYDSADMESKKGEQTSKQSDQNIKEIHISTYAPVSESDTGGDNPSSVEKKSASEENMPVSDSITKAPGSTDTDLPTPTLRIELDQETSTTGGILSTIWNTGSTLGLPRGFTAEPSEALDENEQQRGDRVLSILSQIWKTGSRVFQIASRMSSTGTDVTASDKTENSQQKVSEKAQHVSGIDESSSGSSNTSESGSKTSSEQGSTIFSMEETDTVSDSVLGLNVRKFKTGGSSLLAAAFSEAIKNSVMALTTDTLNEDISEPSQTKDEPVFVSTVETKHEEIVPPSEPKRQSWVVTDVESTENQSLERTLTAVHELEKFANELAASLRHDEKPYTEYIDLNQIFQATVEQGIKSEINVDEFGGDVDDFIKESTRTPPSIVGSTETVMVFGDKPKEAPTKRDNVYKWLRHLESPEDKTEKKVSEDYSVGSTKNEVLEENYEDEINKMVIEAESEQFVEKLSKKKSSEKKLKRKKSKARAKTPCGKCPCCKAMQREKGQEKKTRKKRSCMGHTRSDGDHLRAASSLTLTDLFQEDALSAKSKYSIFSNESCSEDYPLRLREPKKWLKNATDEFMRRECIRQVVLRHNEANQDCQRTGVTRISRAPTSLSDGAVSRVPSNQQLQMMVNTGQRLERGRMVNYRSVKMRVPKACSDCSPPRRRISIDRSCPKRSRSRRPTEEALKRARSGASCAKQFPSSWLSEALPVRRRSPEPKHCRKQRCTATKRAKRSESKRSCSKIRMGINGDERQGSNNKSMFLNGSKSERNINEYETRTNILRKKYCYW